MKSFRSWSGCRTAVTAMVTGLLLASCLPKDTRPPPASIDVTVTADPLSLGGAASFETSDGWSISYDRSLVAMSARLADDTSCARYSDGYSRILDLGIPGPQKLNLLYALGHCDFGFRVSSTNPAIPFFPVDKGIAPADLLLMGFPAIDPYTIGRDGTPQPTGVALYAKGHATKGAVTKTFAWAFRQRVSYQHCAGPRSAPDAGRPDAARGPETAGDSGTRRHVTDAGDGGGPRDSGSILGTGDAADAGVYFYDAGPPGPQGIDLAGGSATTIDIRMHGESLFLDSTNLATGTLRFDVFAAADDKYGNADGDVTLDELGQVLLTDIGIRGRYAELKPDVDALPPNALPWATLEDFVYLGLFPKVARFEDKGACVTTLRGR